MADKTVPTIPAFYACYLLRSTVRHQSLYIGSTPNPVRRLRQHNGECKGGAVKTSRDSLRPWEMTCLVSGFPSKIAALQFEWAWQNTHLTRHVSPNSRLTKLGSNLRASPKTGRARKRLTRPGTSLIDRLANLHLLLRVRSFARWPLKVTFYAEDVYRSWKKWTEQHLERLKSGVDVGLDLPRSEEGLSTSVPAHGIRALDVGYAKLRDRVERTQQLLAEAEWLSCAVCKQGLPASGAMTVVCPAASCGALSHIRCLSAHFLSSDRQEEIVPTSGHCPSCDGSVNWIDVVKELSVRIRGAAEIEKLPKKGRKAKDQTVATMTDAAGELSAEDDEADDIDRLDDGWHELADSSDVEMEQTMDHKRTSRVVARERNPSLVIEDSDWDDAEMIT